MKAKVRLLSAACIALAGISTASMAEINLVGRLQCSEILQQSRTGAKNESAFAGNLSFLDVREGKGQVSLSVPWRIDKTKTVHESYVISISPSFAIGLMGEGSRESAGSWKYDLKGQVSNGSATKGQLTGSLLAGKDHSVIYRTCTYTFDVQGGTLVDATKTAAEAKLAQQQKDIAVEKTRVASDKEALAEQARKVEADKAAVAEETRKLEEVKQRLANQQAAIATEKKQAAEREKLAALDATRTTAARQEKDVTAVEPLATPPATSTQRVNPVSPATSPKSEVQAGSALKPESIESSPSALGERTVSPSFNSKALLLAALAGAGIIGLLVFVVARLRRRSTTTASEKHMAADKSAVPRVDDAPSGLAGKKAEPAEGVQSPSPNGAGTLQAAVNLAGPVSSPVEAEVRVEQTSGVAVQRPAEKPAQMGIKHELISRDLEGRDGISEGEARDNFGKLINLPTEIVQAMSATAGHVTELGPSLDNGARLQNAVDTASVVFVVEPDQQNAELPDLPPLNEESRSNAAKQVSDPIAAPTRSEASATPGAADGTASDAMPATRKVEDTTAAADTTLATGRYVENQSFASSDAWWWLGIALSASVALSLVIGFGVLIRTGSTSEFLAIACSISVFAASVWVAIDAVKNGLQKHPAGGFFNLTPGGWGAVVLLITVIALPAYLFKRAALIEQARLSGRAQVFSGKVGYGIAIAVFLVFFAMNVLRGSLPSCDSKEVLSLAHQILRENVQLGRSGLELGNILQPAQVSYDGKVRGCRGFVKNPAGGPLPIDFQVSWHDEVKGVIYVELGASPATPPASIPKASRGVAVEAPLLLLSNAGERQAGFIIVSGEVRNVSGVPLNGVEAVVIFRGADGGVIRTDEALVDFNPIMPGQVSPFKVMGRANPLIAKFDVAFKEFGGASLAHRISGRE